MSNYTGGGKMSAHSADMMVHDLVRGLPVGERRTLAELFVRRLLPLLQRVVEDAPAESLKQALASPTDVGTLARMLTAIAADPHVQSLDPLAEAFARGAQLQQEMLEQAGGAWSARQVAAHLGVSRQAVDKRRKRGTLLAVESAGSYAFPACQFTASGVLPGLPEVLQAIDSPNGWTKLSLLLSDTLRGREQTVIDALRNGDLEDALHAARTWGTQGAA
jgi:hypothetical protein